MLKGSTKLFEEGLSTICHLTFPSNNVKPILTARLFVSYLQNLALHELQLLAYYSISSKVSNKVRNTLRIKFYIPKSSPHFRNFQWESITINLNLFPSWH